MTLLGALAQRANINNPNVPITSENIAEYAFGAQPTFAGVNVTEERAYGLTAYFRGVALLSSVIAQLPLKVYRNGTRERVTQRTVLDNPNPAMTPFEFRQTMAANAITWGTGYARKYRNRADAVAEVWPIHPSKCKMHRVKPTPANDSGRVFEVVDMDGSVSELTPWEITAMPYLSPWGGEGLRPLQLARQVLGVNIAAEETAAKFYGKGTMLSGILRTDKELGEIQARRLKRRWRQMSQGQDNVGDIAVLDNNATFEPITIPPQDAELLASRQFGVSEVARLLGVPPIWLMDMEKSTSWGAGIEQQSIGLSVYTIDGWLTLIEQRITREWLPGGWSAGSWYAEHVTEGLLRGDSKARSAFYHQAITDGWMNRNEVRVRENLEPVEGGDEFLVPSNMTLVSIDGKLIPLTDAGIDNATEEA